MKVWCMVLLGSIMSRRTVFMLCIMQAAGYDLDRRYIQAGSAWMFSRLPVRGLRQLADYSPDHRIQI
jgi:hypothetical protein